MNTPTKAQALEALDSLDDYARMTVSVDAHGPVKCIRTFINDVTAAIEAVVPTLAAAQVSIEQMTKLAGEAEAEARSLLADLPALQRKADAWDALVALAGHWQDGSQTTVRLLQDDATRECGVQVGDEPFRATQPARRTYWAPSFENAVEHATQSEQA